MAEAGEVIAGAAGSGAVPDVEATRALAREILSRPDYAQHRRDPSFLQEWIDGLAERLVQAWQFVADLLPDWLVGAWDGFWSGLRDLLAATLGQDGLTVLVRLAVALAIFGALAIAAHHALRILRGPGAPVGSDPEAPAGSGPDLLADAERHARDGRFLEAAHCVQLAALQSLLKKKCIELERSDPNRTLRTRLVEAPLAEPVRDRFLALLDRLEGHWFRDRVGDRQLYADWRSLHAQIDALPEPR